MKLVHTFIAVAALAGSLAITSAAQEPKPGPARPMAIPAVKEAKLKNGMTVAVAEKSGVPLVTVQLLVRAGSSNESMDKAGLADLTASMLTKGTKTRTAEQIAQEIEFLGGSINSGAGWNSSSVTVSVTSDKVEQALAIMSDVILNPSFPQSELDLLKSQAIDGLTYNLTQPGFLANYTAAKYSFGEHPPGGTPASIASITLDDVKSFHARNYRSDMSVLIFGGDITTAAAVALAGKMFDGLTRWDGEVRTKAVPASRSSEAVSAPIKRLLILDLPESGQAAVTYTTKIAGIGRRSPSYYPASVLNSLLGGGYSSRLNQEIRIKRGLSYGAGSSFAWRINDNNFATRTQTKNESAAEVAELVLAEIKRLAEGEIPSAELDPRKSVLTGGFGRTIETTGGLVNALADLYTFGVPSAELNKYMKSVNSVGEAQIREFSKANLLGGDIVIVGDYAKFKDDLAKRFPNIKPEIIPVAELDITEADLRK